MGKIFRDEPRARLSPQLKKGIKGERERGRNEKKKTEAAATAVKRKGGRQEGREEGSREGSREGRKEGGGVGYRREIFRGERGSRATIRTVTAYGIRSGIRFQRRRDDVWPPKSRYARPAVCHSDAIINSE